MDNDWWWGCGGVGAFAVEHSLWCIRSVMLVILTLFFLVLIELVMRFARSLWFFTICFLTDRPV